MRSDKLVKKILKTVVGLILITLLSLIISIEVLRNTARKKAIKALDELTYMVSSEGCYNQSLKDSIESSLNNIYGSSYKSDTNNDGVVDNNDDTIIHFDIDCTAVTNQSGDSLYNDNANSYINHVQRGETMNCSVTVTISYRTPIGVFGVGQPIAINENITVGATAISNRWFKGEV